MKFQIKLFDVFVRETFQSPAEVVTESVFQIFVLCTFQKLRIESTKDQSLRTSTTRPLSRFQSNRIFQRLPGLFFTVEIKGKQKREKIRGPIPINFNSEHYRTDTNRRKIRPCVNPPLQKTPLSDR